MIAVPTNMISEIKQSPGSWEMTVYTDDYKSEITDKCKFEFAEEPVQDVKISKNQILIGKKPKPFVSKVRVTYKNEERFIYFSLA